MTLVTAEELAFSTSLSHRLGRTGVAFDAALTLGRAVSSDRLRGTLNRLVLIPDEHLARATPDDKAYASQELHALFTSALHGLGGTVLNRAGPRGLCGPWLAPAEWVAEAARSGLVVEPFPVRSTTLQPDPAVAPTRQAFVVGDTFLTVNPDLGTAPAPVAEGCRALAARCGVGLLGVDFVEGPGTPWTFAGATCRPELRPGGPALLDALFTELTA